MDELTDDELTRIADLQFLDELSTYVALLPPLSPDMERAYQDKMDLLEQIHSEVFPPPPVGEECDDHTYDSRYYHEYQVSFGSNNSFDWTVDNLK